MNTRWLEKLTWTFLIKKNDSLSNFFLDKLDENEQINNLYRANQEVHKMQKIKYLKLRNTLNQIPP